MRFSHPKETRLAATMEQIMSLGKTCGVILILSCYAPLQAASIVIISSAVRVQGRASGNVYSNADGGAISGATGDGSNWRASSSGSMSTIGHQYRLDLFAKSEIGDFRDGSANLNLTIMPEPTSMLLLAPGLVGLTLRRNRKACLYHFHTNCVSTSSL